MKKIQVDGSGLIYRQERPSWCPHKNCNFLRRVMDNLCGGSLPKPEPHDGDSNTHRLCINDGEVFDLKVNVSDLDWLRWIFDAIDGRKTSWLSSDRISLIEGREVKPYE